MAIVCRKSTNAFVVTLNEEEIKLYAHYAALLHTVPFILFQEFVNRHLLKTEENCKPGGTLIGNTD